MATAVLDLDMNELPEEINGLEKYDKAFLLLRDKRIPLCTIIVPVDEGMLRIDDHVDQMLLYTGDALIRHRVQESIGVQPVEPTRWPSSTIAICTRDRTDDLSRCLTSLMQLRDVGQEILVVDNAPRTADTRLLVQRFPEVRYVVEARPGLNIARNRALKEAKGEIVAFIDDDAVPDQDWLVSLLRHYERDRIVCVTGMTLPLELETDGQEAFEAYNPFSKGFHQRLYDPSWDPLRTGQVGAGANMSFRRSVIKLVGWFDEALDAGTPTQSGGDHEYFTRILRKGYYIMYAPEALNWHRHRRTMEETRKAIYGYGVGVYAYWTRLFWYDREFTVIRYAWGWFWHDQLPRLTRALLKRPGHQPLRLIIAELMGCLQGPAAYFKSRRRLHEDRGSREKRIHYYANA